MKSHPFPFSTVGLVMCALTAAASSAFAQSQGEPPPQRSSASGVEVTPFVSMGSPTSSRVGGAVSFPVTSNLSIEAELGYRRGEGDINALSSTVSMLYDLPTIGRIAPYLAAGAGLEEYGAPVVLPPGGTIFTQPKLGFAVNAGGGIKVPVDNRWALRSDARWIKSLGRHGSEHWRLYQSASLRVGKRRDAPAGK